MPFNLSDQIKKSNADFLEIVHSAKHSFRMNKITSAKQIQEQEKVMVNKLQEIAKERQRHQEIQEASAKANIELLTETKNQNEILHKQLTEVITQKELLEKQLTEQKTVNEQLTTEFRMSAREAVKMRTKTNISIIIAVIGLLISIVSLFITLWR